MERKIHINQDTTANLSNEKLDELVFNKANEKYYETFGEPFLENPNDILMLQIFSCCVLDFEVRNGGFDQFFLNNENLIDFALAGLQKIGAAEHINLLRAATKIYSEQKNQFKDGRNLNLYELDEKYYTLTDVSEIRQKFVAANIEKFYDEKSYR